MILDRVRLILGLTTDDKDELLGEFIDGFTTAVNLYCGTETLPTQLEFIVVEATVARYNRVGSEGITKEKVDVLSTEFQMDILGTYEVYLNSYIKSNPGDSGSAKRIKFL